MARNTLEGSMRAPLAGARAIGKADPAERAPKGQALLTVLAQVSG